ncbi:MAG: CHAP domain-containing protein [Deltaproteobacteria bacterium]|nr:CHAP domain-containing protein [Deltaproteobacteria bacterium]
MSVSRSLRFVSVLAALSSLGPATAAQQNICNETVPANRYIDGIPAYSQCDASLNATIFSDNGVNTSTASLGSSWVLTQWSGGYQCTEYANRYLRFRWNVNYRGGMAKDWCNGPFPDTLVSSSNPIHGDVIVFAPGACGADQTTGHVAVVDTVDTASARMTFVEQNRASRRTCAINTATCFLHVVANDGSIIDSGVPFDAGATFDGGMLDSGTDDATVFDAAPDGSPAAGPDGQAGGNGAAGSGGPAGGSGGPGAIGAAGAAGPGDSPAAGNSVDASQLAGSSGLAGMPDQAGYSAYPATTSNDSGCACELSRGNASPGNLVVILLLIAVLTLRSRAPNGLKRK